MKKAYLVTFNPCTRVVVDENATDAEITEAAREKIIAKPDEYISEENLVAIDYDKECPYDPETDDKEVNQPILFNTLDITSFEHPEFEADLNCGKFDLTEYNCTIHKTGEMPENWQLTIYTDIQAGDIETVYHYDTKGEAENDLQEATKHYQISFDLILPDGLNITG